MPKTVIVADPTPTTDGLTVTITRLKGQYRIEAHYNQPGVDPVMWQGASIPAPVNAQINSLLTAIVNAAKGPWGF